MISRRLTKDGSFTLYSEQYKQTFHSINGSKTEADHVFLRASGVENMLTAGQHVRVLEVGFGTGLNFFLTADLALQHKAKLHYWAFEQDLLSGDVMTSLSFEQLISHPGLFKQFIQWRNAQKAVAAPGLLSWEFNDSLSLCIILGDAITSTPPNEQVDAIYLDAFSPDQNPELWTVSFFEKLYKSLARGRKLSTYSAKSQVRKNMNAAGFHTTRQPGPPGKREMLVATKPTHNI